MITTNERIEGHLEVRKSSLPATTCGWKENMWWRGVW